MDPAPATCPRCRQPLDDKPLVRHCPRCKGSWIAEETLHARAASHAAPSAPALTWHAEARAALPCAVCESPMETVVVRDTAVDRCPRHGVWFDANELMAVLMPIAAVHQIAAVPAQQHELYVTDVVAEGALEIASEGGVFEVVVGGVGFVAEAVVEVIGSIFSSIFD